MRLSLLDSSARRALQARARARRSVGGRRRRLAAAFGGGVWRRRLAAAPLPSHTGAAAAQQQSGGPAAAAAYGRRRRCACRTAAEICIISNQSAAREAAAAALLQLLLQRMDLVPTLVPQTAPAGRRRRCMCATARCGDVLLTGSPSTSALASGWPSKPPLAKVMNADGDDTFCLSTLLLLDAVPAVVDAVVAQPGVRGQSVDAGECARVGARGGLIMMRHARPRSASPACRVQQRRAYDA